MKERCLQISMNRDDPYLFPHTNLFLSRLPDFQVVCILLLPLESCLDQYLELSGALRSSGFFQIKVRGRCLESGNLSNIRSVSCQYLVAVQPADTAASLGLQPCSSQMGLDLVCGPQSREGGPSWCSLAQRTAQGLVGSLNVCW